jgi:hypothetical protein
VDLQFIQQFHRKKAIPPKEVATIIEKNIDLLAQAEHDGWMQFKIANGWKYGVPRNDKMKTHNALVRFQDLSEDDKEKDRENVRRYPEIVKKAKFKIIFEK